MATDAAVSTLHISGFPPDASVREMMNWCRPCAGFDFAVAKYHSRSVFVKFKSLQTAALAVDQLHGMLFDESNPDSEIQAAFARRDADRSVPSDGYGKSGDAGASSARPWASSIPSEPSRKSHGPPPPPPPQPYVPRPPSPPRPTSGAVPPPPPAPASLGRGGRRDVGSRLVGELVALPHPGASLRFISCEDLPARMQGKEVFVLPSSASAVSHLPGGTRVSFVLKEEQGSGRPQAEQLEVLDPKGQGGKPRQQRRAWNNARDERYDNARDERYDDYSQGKMDGEEGEHASPPENADEDGGDIGSRFDGELVGAPEKAKMRWIRCEDLPARMRGLEVFVLPRWLELVLPLPARTRVSFTLKEKAGKPQASDVEVLEESRIRLTDAPEEKDDEDSAGQADDVESDVASPSDGVKEDGDTGVGSRFYGEVVGVRSTLARLRFIKCPDLPARYGGADVFVLTSSMKVVAPLPGGTRVSFTLKDKAGKPQAEEVEVEDSERPSKRRRTYEDDQDSEQDEEDRAVESPSDRNNDDAGDVGSCFEGEVVEPPHSQAKFIFLRCHDLPARFGGADVFVVSSSMQTVRDLPGGTRVRFTLCEKGDSGKPQASDVQVIDEDSHHASDDRDRRRPSESHQQAQRRRQQPRQRAGRDHRSRQWKDNDTADMLGVNQPPPVPGRGSHGRGGAKPSQRSWTDG